MQLLDFRCIKHFLTYEATILVANALVSNQLNYCNSLFKSLSKFNLCKLLCIQKIAARIVSNMNIALASC